MSAALPLPLWRVTPRAEPLRSVDARARSAWAAWAAVSCQLGNPAFGDVEVVELPEPPVPTPATAELVTALRAGPCTLLGLRNRLSRAGRRLSTAEVLEAVEAGFVRFNHLTQKYEAAR